MQIEALHLADMRGGFAQKKSCYRPSRNSTFASQIRHAFSEPHDGKDCTLDLLLSSFHRAAPRIDDTHCQSVMETAVAHDVLGWEAKIRWKTSCPEGSCLDW